MTLLHSCPFLLRKRAVLREGVTDEGIRALASAGCGEKLTSLTLESECTCCSFGLFLDVACVVVRAGREWF